MCTSMRVSTKFCRNKASRRAGRQCRRVQVKLPNDPVIISQISKLCNILRNMDNCNMYASIENAKFQIIMTSKIEN